MKIRTDFVTNSSSSSFIIAMRNDITKEEVKTILEQNKDRVEGFTKYSIEYLDIGEYLNSEGVFDENERYNRVLNKLVEEFMDLSIDMKLDNWNLTAMEGGNECCSGLVGNFLYSALSHISTEKFKISAS